MGAGAAMWQARLGAVAVRACGCRQASNVRSPHHHHLQDDPVPAHSPHVTSLHHLPSYPHGRCLFACQKVFLCAVCGNHLAQRYNCLFTCPPRLLPSLLSRPPPLLFPSYLSALYVFQPLGFVSRRHDYPRRLPLTPMFSCLGAAGTRASVGRS